MDHKIVVSVTLTLCSLCSADIDTCIRGPGSFPIPPTLVGVEGKYDMFFKREAGSSDPTMVHIRCTANDKLGNVYISNESEAFVFVFIYGWDPSGGQHAGCHRLSA